MGPLSGVKVIEFAGIGPGPFCGMLLSDLGANVVRIDRKGSDAASAAMLSNRKFDVTARGRRSIALNLKKPEAVQACLKLLNKADILFEGFRPGVMERIGLSPDVCLSQNPKLVYGRMTGWGQTGMLSKAAGHDINYISLTGALHAIGTEEKPLPPLNLVGDFGGGALYLAFGLISALFEAQRSGKGQVVDAAMTEGAASLMAMHYGLHAAGAWNDERSANLLDGGAHFYNCYKTSNNKFISLGSIEPKFYAMLREATGMSDPIFDEQMDRSKWPQQKAALAHIIAQKTQAEWCEILEGTDICFAPVLSMDEAPIHPHNVERDAYVTIDGVTQPNAMPKFSRTPGKVQGPPPAIGEHNQIALTDWGFSEDDISALHRADAI